MLVKITDDEYFSRPEISHSDLELVRKSLKHYVYFKQNKQESSALDFGKAFHTFILEPDLFKDQILVAPGTRYTKAYKDLVAANPKKTVITDEEFQKLYSMRQSLMSMPKLSKLLNADFVEHAMFWQHAESGVDCRSKMDLVHKDGVVIDLKTTENASQIDFEGSIKAWGYHRQGALYLDGLNALFGKGSYHSFVILAVEKKPPFNCAAYSLPDHLIVDAAHDNLLNLLKIKQAKLTNHFPGYPDEVQTIGV